MITSVAFDLDDTLYDEVEYCKSGFAAVAEFVGKLANMPTAERIFDALWKEFSTGNRTKTFNAVFDKLGASFDDKLIAQLVEAYRNHRPKIKLPQDSRDALNQLSDKYTLALLTDGFLPAQRLKVQALGIEKYFKCIIYTEELGSRFWKPSPVGFEKLMETLKTKPEHTAYVADNPIKDFIAPNKLGILSIQIIRPVRIPRESPKDSGVRAKYVIHRLTELSPLIDRL